MAKVFTINQASDEKVGREQEHACSRQQTVERIHSEESSVSRRLSRKNGNVAATQQTGYYSGSGYLMSENLPPGTCIIEKRNDGLSTSLVYLGVAVGRISANGAGRSFDAAHTRHAPESNYRRRPLRFSRPLQ